MGLKKDDSSMGEVVPSEPVVQEPAPDPVPAKPKAKAAPAPAVEAPSGKNRANERVLPIIAIERAISDPTTGITFNLNFPQNAMVWEGNWVDCQMRVGILKEYTGPTVE